MQAFKLPFSKLALAVSALTLSASALAVPTYGNIAAPGVYFGSGNINGNWTIDTSNDVEVALRIKNRGTGATIDGSSGIYRADPGLCNPICSGGPKAAWNYEFSVNTQAGGGNLDLTQVFAILEVDTDASAGTSFTALDLFANWNDNSYWSGTRRVGAGPALAGEYGVQQSANPLFGNSGFGFLPGAGLYDLRLSVYANNSGVQGALLASTSTQVAIPEPGSLALAGLALAGLATLRRRRT